MSKEKKNKVDVHYVNYGRNERRCVFCSHYQGHGACDDVVGMISPDGWCNGFNASGWAKSDQTP